MPKEEIGEEISYMLVNLTNGSYRVQSNSREFCNDQATLLTIKGQPVHPTTPTGDSVKEISEANPKAPTKKPRKRPAAASKEKEEDTLEPDAKKALFVEP